MRNWFSGGAGLALAIGILVGSLSAAEVAYRDDFSLSRGRFEFVGGNVWKIGGGRCRFSSAGHERFAILNVEDLRQLRIEAEVAIDRRLGSGWVTAGLALVGDAENHWRLLLVAGPQDQRYFELVERFQGVHQAQNAPPPARTRLDVRHEGGLARWRYGRPYRMTLSLTPESITGEIRDEEGKQFWRATCVLGDAQAVRSGRPALTANGVEGSFRDLVVEGAALQSTDLLEVPPGLRGNAAIVGDEGNRVAPVLERRLANEGFGTKVLSWDEMERWRMSGERLDLLVLADARRAPVSAARKTVSFLRSRGKLIAIGAPAFGERLWKTSQGYVSVERYAESIYGTLAKQPIELTAAGWRRGAMKPARRGAIALEPPATWRITSDLEGWDTFIHRLDNGFGRGGTLLCFRAKGDANTPQLAIECNERDGSRWIATVELSPQWRQYVLWPSDFLYWHDSPAQRGGPGDRFNPAAAVSIHVGLSASHTPKCRPGEHALWIADLATAPDAGVAQPDAELPEIEGLYPSYKLYPLKPIRTLLPTGAMLAPMDAQQCAAKGYSPVWRETGSGFDRGRPWRWVRLVEAVDQDSIGRGALISLMLGQSVFPGAMWLNVGVADPAELGDGPLAQALLPAVIKAAKAMADGCFLLEGGSRYFSYRRGEPVELGATVINAGRGARTVRVRFGISAEGGTKRLLEQTHSASIPSGEQRQVSLTWSPPPTPSQRPLEVFVELLDPANGQAIDAIRHEIDLLSEDPARPEEFVRVEGPRFTLGGKPWCLLGVNYWPTSQGGRPTLATFRRDVYDPEIMERDMRWMESMGINLLSGIQAPTPDDPAAPGAFRDLHDFLHRCRRHNLKVFYFLHGANPLAGGSFEAIRKHIEAAGIKDHPAILAWELAWEPIYYSGPAGGQLDFLIPDWNAWIVERYDSLENAERDWGYKLPRLGQDSEVSKTPANPARVGLPRPEWCLAHGPWDKVTAAFRRFFSDHVGQAYGRLIRELRRYDPNHLITFRFGACGIPNQAWFAHAHSAGVAKHVDFLCPEGYNLQSGFAKATPADEIRKGGLVTLYYRFLSREKPVVWMEFGYTVNGFQTRWKTGMEHISPTELALQRTEYENFYAMFLESGARGAAPWWLPGGFRLDERSDFGILEPDGTERPACQVLRERLPQFAKLGDATCVAPAKPASDDPRPTITLDLDAHYADAWEFYAPQYLQHVRAGRLPYLRTAGTGTTSANCPLVAVGNTPLNGHNPPQFLNAEFNRVEWRAEGSPWREAGREGIRAKHCAILRCRVSVGNTGEAAWLAPEKAGGQADGRVFLRCTVQPSGVTIDVPIPCQTPYLTDVEIGEFTVPLSDADEQAVACRMFTTRRQADGAALTVPFGERKTIRIRAER